jgi:hypothetical protein
MTKNTPLKIGERVHKGRTKSVVVLNNSYNKTEHEFIEIYTAAGLFKTVHEKDIALSGENAQFIELKLSHSMKIWYL